MPDVELSLCMIVRNAAPDLAACLDACRPVVDEIVILDTGSTDDTIATARRFGARVALGEWHDDFARARNEARLHASGRWILSLDADERLDYMNGHRLRRAIRAAEEEGLRSGDTVLALALVLVGEVGREGTGVFTRHVFPRVFRNDPEIRWEGALHEQLVHSRVNLIAATRLTDVMVRHLGYARAEARDSRRERNARILDRALPAAPTPFERLSRAHSAITFQRYDEALIELRRLITERLPSNLDATARWSLTTTLLACGRRDEARRTLEEAMAAHSRHVGFPYLLGLVDLDDNRPGDARVRFEEILARPAPPLCDQTDVLPSRATIEVHRARSFLAAGEVREALRQLDAVLAREPRHPEGRFQRAVALQTLGRCEEALDALEALNQEVPGDPAVDSHLQRCRSAVPLGHADGLSACIIARNERRNLEELVPALRALADEIVVVDTGSTDGGDEVAQRLGARVVRRTWSDDFAAARNAGLEAVTRRWVLWLDADERLSPSSLEAVRAFIGRRSAEAACVTIRSAHAEGDPVGWSSGVYCRLFRADLGARFEGRIHEQILPALERCGARVEPSTIVIEHGGYALDPETMRAKKERNLRLLELEAARTPRDHYLWFQIGTTQVALGQFAAAREALAKALELAPAGTAGEVQVWIHLRLAQASFATDRLDDALAHARAALRLRPALELGHYIAAGVWARRGRLPRALVCLRRILNEPEPDPLARLRRDPIRQQYERLQRARSQVLAA